MAWIWLLACRPEAPPATPVPSAPAPSAPAAAASVRAFTFDLEVTVPLDPLRAFDAFTLDVAKWWDHTFSPEPVALVIEPKIGGAFYEQFDAEGNGARHADVILVVRGKTLRLRGPLGLSGMAVDLVQTLEFTAADAGTEVHLHVEGSGPLDDATVEVVRGVWQHFLDERYRPYAESLAAAR
jgi:hypothetical protein